MKFRNLNADEIDARVSTVTDKGCSLLLYKDARVDQNILDETVGANNWQRSHDVIGGNLYCTVSIWDEDKKEWVSKQDVGTESYTEKEKGQASDSFKRACFNWGIGRELYTAPFIWINKGNVQITEQKEQKGKYTTKDRFKVKEIGYDKKGNINKLEIVNVKMKKVVYKLGDDLVISEKEQMILKSMIEKRGLDLKKALNGMELDQITGEVYQDAITRLQKIPEVNNAKDNG